MKQWYGLEIRNDKIGIVKSQGDEFAYETWRERVRRGEYPWRIIVVDEPNVFVTKAHDLVSINFYV